ncbi:MAG: hypothetical protein AB1846_07240 [Chloroflexota bacterium]
MAHRFLLFPLLIASLLAGCNLPLATSTAPVTIAPVTTVPPTGTPTATPDYRACGFQWASQSLLDLSAQLTEAFTQAGLEVASARAEAYGENCMDEYGQVVYFAAMETDFRITIEVASLDDEAELARLLDASLAVLDGFPPDETPGPQPGYIGIAFEEASGESLNLWFQASRADALRRQGLGGVELLQALKNQALPFLAGKTF